jgi:hypothetical protein
MKIIVRFFLLILIPANLYFQVKYLLLISFHFYLPVSLEPLFRQGFQLGERNRPTYVQSCSVM